MSIKQQTSVEERANFLSTIEPFRGLERTNLLKVADDFGIRSYHRGDKIFHQGDSSHDLYIVYQGKIRIFKTSVHGDETSINFFTERDIIGEFSIIDSKPRSASAKAITKCILWHINQHDFYHHLKNTPNFAISMCHLLTSKARWTAGYAEIVAQYSSDERFLRLLLLYSEDKGRIIGQGQCEIDFGLNQADLASLIGVRREWMSRKLNEWKIKGLLQYDKGKIIIPSLKIIQEVIEQFGQSKEEKQQGKTNIN